MEEPLAVETRQNSLEFIIDRDTKEEYAWVEGGVLWLAHPEVGDEKEGIVPKYPLENVTSIKLAHTFCHVIITTDDGKEHMHMRRMGPDVVTATQIKSEVCSRYDFETDRDNPNAIEDIIKAEFPMWEDTIWFDTVRNRVIVNTAILGGLYKWVPITGPSDHIVTELRKKVYRIEKEIVSPKGATRTVLFKPFKEAFYDAIMNLGYSNPHDPFMETIRRTEWDGMPRLNTFLADLGGKAHLPREDWEAEYLAAVGRGIFLSVIQRHRSLDCPQSIPFIPVFIADQYVGKSYLVKAIGMISHYGGTDKSLDAVEDLYYEVQGKSVVELRESTQFTVNTVEMLKAFADTASLQIRFKYDKMPTENIPITFTAIATTNNFTILRDDSGNRRFFVVYFEPNFDPECGPISRKVEEYYVDPDNHSKGVTEEMYQLWAEALALYDDPESPQRWNSHMYDKSGRGFKRFYGLAQSTATVNLDWEYRLMLWLDKKYPRKGDLVESHKIKNFLEDGAEGCGLKDKALAEAMRKLGKNVQKYDLRKIKDLNTPTYGHYKVYVRTADAVFTEDSDLENVRDITEYAQEDPMDMHYS